MKSFEGSFCNLNFSLSTSILLNSVFLSIYIYYMFFYHIKTSLLSNNRFAIKTNLSFLKKPLFQNLRWSCDFPPRKMVAQKHRAISRQEQMAFSTPVSGCLGTPLPLPQSLYVQATKECNLTIFCRSSNGN